MRQRVVHGDHDVEGFGKGIGKSAEVRAFKAKRDAALCGARFCLFELGVADVRRGHVIAEPGQADRLGPDPAGTVEDAGSAVKAAAFEQSVKDDSLFVRLAFPVKEQLVVLRGHVVIKGLDDVHGESPFPAGSTAAVFSPPVSRNAGNE